MAESIQSDARQQQIDAVCKNIIKQLKEGQSKEAIASLKRALERYPESPQLRGLHSQIQQKVKASKIKKLEYEAMVLIQKGAESEGQKKLREIYQLDPSRTDLKNASEKKLREESQQDYHVSMRKHSVRQLYLTWITAVVVVAGVSIAIAGWSNRRHLKNAREHIDNGAYQSAVAELDDCGWLMAGQKPNLWAELAEIEKDTRSQAEDSTLTRNYDKAVELTRKAMYASQFPEDYEESIQELLNLKREEQEAQSAAMRSKQDCQAASYKASGSKAEMDAASLWEQATVLSGKAEQLLAAKEYVQARETWLKAIELFDNAAKTAIQTQADRADANTARQRCLQKTLAAQKMNAPIEASSQWAQACDMAAGAEEVYQLRDYSAAGEKWEKSSQLFDSAIEVCRRSPSFMAAAEKINQWKALHLAMSEKAVTSLLGEPICRIAESSRCVLYYQALPEPAGSREFAAGSREFAPGCLEPAAGYIVFENKGLELAIENARQAHEKEMSAENRRYEAELKRSQKMAQENTRIPGQQNPRTRNRNVQDAERAIAATHQEKLRKIEAEYAMIQRNFREGVTPINPVYLTSEWIAPEPNDIAALVSSADPPPATLEQKWQSPENWKKLKLNMELKYVENLLGNLAGVGIADEKSYQLGNIAGFGHLRFARGIDGEPRLTYWKEPFWPAVWDSFEPAGSIISDSNDLLVQVSYCTGSER